MTKFPARTTATLNAVSAYAENFAVAVGDDGTILEWDGAEWTLRWSPTGSHLTHLRVNGPNDAVALSSTDLVKYDGTSWIVENSPLVVANSTGNITTTVAIPQKLTSFYDHALDEDAQWIFY